MFFDESDKEHSKENSNVDTYSNESSIICTKEQCSNRVSELDINFQKFYAEINKEFYCKECFQQRMENGKEEWFRNKVSTEKRFRTFSGRTNIGDVGESWEDLQEEEDSSAVPYGIDATTTSNKMFVPLAFRPIPINSETAFQSLPNTPTGSFEPLNFGGSTSESTPNVLEFTRVMKEKEVDKTNYIENFGYLYFDNYPFACIGQTIFITDFNSDIVSHILMFLPFRDRMSLKNACTYFYNLYSDESTRSIFYYQEEKRLINYYSSKISSNELDNRLAALIHNDGVSPNINWQYHWEYALENHLLKTIEAMIKKEQTEDILSKAYNIPSSQIRQFITQQVCQQKNISAFNLLNSLNFALPDIKCFSDIVCNNKEQRSTKINEFVEEVSKYDFVTDLLDISLPLLLSNGFHLIVKRIITSDTDFDHVPDIEKLWKKLIFIAIEEDCQDIVDILVEKWGVKVDEQYVKFAFNMGHFDMFCELLKYIECASTQISIWFANSIASDNTKFYHYLLSHFEPDFDVALQKCIQHNLTSRMCALLNMSLSKELQIPTRQQLFRGVNHLESEWVTKFGITRAVFQNLIYQASKANKTEMIQLLLKDVRSYYCIDNKFIESMLKSSLSFCQMLLNESPCRVDFAFDDSILFHRVATYPSAMEFLLTVPKINPRSHNDMGLFRVLHYMVEQSLTLLKNDDRFIDVRWRIEDVLSVLQSNSSS